MTSADRSQNEVEVRLADLRQWQHALPRCSALLDRQERERAARFRDPVQGDRYRLTHGLLRLLLGKYVGIDAAALEFSTDTHGKPHLACESVPRAHFNISHSGDFAAFAFAHAGAVGVDIERMRLNMPRMEEIAGRYFAPGEYKQLLELGPAERPPAFFRCWTRKEAFLKARGDGIFGGLEGFEVSVGGISGNSSLLVSIGGEAQLASAWSMADLPSPPEYAGAVAVAAPACVFNFGSVSEPGV